MDIGSKTAWLFAAWVGALGIPGLASAGLGDDQIALVIPAVEYTGNDLDDDTAIWMSYIVGQRIKVYFDRGSAGSGIHRSTLVIVPGRLGTTDPMAVTQLARINGAQIAVVLTAFRKADGMLIDTVMAIPDKYDDMRANPVEVIELAFDGAVINLDVPSRYVSLSNLFLGNDLIQSYVTGPYREVCPQDRQCKNPTGNCKLLGRDIPVAEVVRYLEFGETAKLKYNGVCYTQRFPTRRPISEPVIDFIVGVQRYFAGDWKVSIERMSAVVNSDQSSNNMILQANLYLARASVRLGNPDDAFKYLRLASSIDDQDPKVVETKLFLGLWAITRSIEARKPDTRALLSQLEDDVRAESSYVQRRYGEMLSRLKLRVARMPN